MLHNLTANHKDSNAQRNNDRTEFNQIGFNCECYSVVATSPFTEISTNSEIQKLIHYSHYTEGTATSLSSFDHYYSDLRGPPAKV